MGVFKRVWGYFKIEERGGTRTKGWGLLVIRRKTVIKRKRSQNMFTLDVIHEIYIVIQYGKTMNVETMTLYKVTYRFGNNQMDNCL